MTSKIFVFKSKASLSIPVLLMFITESLCNLLSWTSLHTIYLRYFRGNEEN